jgi:hypothetical protein
MAISVTTAMPTSFKGEVLQALHDFTLTTGNVFKIALLKATAAGAGTFGAATTNYSNLSTGFTDFADTTWTAATFTTCGALIYNTSSTNRAAAVLSFGGDQQVSSGDFQIQFPAAAAATAIIRIA